MLAVEFYYRRSTVISKSIESLFSEVDLDLWVTVYNFMMIKFVIALNCCVFLKAVFSGGHIQQLPFKQDTANEPLSKPLHSL